MEKVVAAFDARRQFGKILQEVLRKGDRFIIERHGEGVAAIVPIEVYEEWKKARTAFFDRARAAAKEAHLPPKKADLLAGQAVQAIRAHKA
jgi:prevent-host-death family protein